MSPAREGYLVNHTCLKDSPLGRVLLRPGGERRAESLFTTDDIAEAIAGLSSTGRRQSGTKQSNQVEVCVSRGRNRSGASGVTILVTQEPVRGRRLMENWLSGGGGVRMLEANR